MKKLIHTLLSLFKIIGIFCLWFLLTALITISLSKLEKEYYKPTDTPNERFMVNGQRWQDFVNNPQALQTEYSEYQIDGDIVIPISFEQQNFGHFVIAMFLAFLIISFLKYLYAIYKIRKDKTALIAYHKKLSKKLLIFVVIVGAIWSLIWCRHG